MLLLINAKSHSITIQVNVISRVLGSNSLLLALRSVGRDGLRFITRALKCQTLGCAVMSVPQKETNAHIFWCTVELKLY